MADNKYTGKPLTPGRRATTARKWDSIIAAWVGVSIGAGQRAAAGLGVGFGPAGPVRTGHDMTTDEIRALERRYGCTVLPEAYL